MTLAGFAGLVAAFRRGGQWKALDAYRQRQIPEMALATALIALLTMPLENTVAESASVVRIVAALGLAFTFGHMVALIARSRAFGIKLATVNVVAAGVIDVTVLGLAVLTLVSGDPVAFEWLLVSMLARPMVAFVVVLGDVTDKRA
jgi:hypothetical protein